MSMATTPFAIPASSLPSISTFMAAAPSTTLGVTRGLFGLSLANENLLVVAMCIAFFLSTLLVVSICGTKVSERETSSMAVGALPATVQIPMHELETVKIEASDFTYGEGEEAHREDGSDGECSICLIEFEKGNACRIFTKCGHIFHRNCINQWLKVERNCPLCRSCVCIVVHSRNRRID